MNCQRDEQDDCTMEDCNVRKPLKMYYGDDKDQKNHTICKEIYQEE